MALPPSSSFVGINNIEKPQEKIQPPQVGGLPQVPYVQMALQMAGSQHQQNSQVIRPLQSTSDVRDANDSIPKSESQVIAPLTISSQ